MIPESSKKALSALISNEQTAISNGHKILYLEQIQRIAGLCGCSIRDVEIECLSYSIIPNRYIRNIGSLGIDGQSKLLESTVAVVGLGGLGGFIVEALARAGVGKLVLIDGDKFQDNNLNRQLLSSESNIGRQKAIEAQRHVAKINSATETEVHSTNIDDMNYPDLIGKSNILVDAVDSINGRLKLQKYAQSLGIPLVHGSVAGFMGQVMTIFPSDIGLYSIYGNDSDDKKTGLESSLGNLAPTPIAVAAWQAQEVIKLITGKGRPLRNEILLMNMEFNSTEIISLL